MASTGAKVGGASAAVLLLAGTIIARWEGVEYTPYLDPIGIPTVCYGHVLPKGSDMTRKYTAAECKDFLRTDMLVANAHVRRCVGREMPAGVEAALTSLVFNAGPKPVCSGSPGRFARVGDWANACKSLDLYKYAGGRVFRGLVLRRADERRVCEQSIPSA